MNWRNFLIVASLSLVSVVSFAQSNLLNAKTPDEIGKKTEAQLLSDNDKPLEYGYVHDRDVLMGKTVWEIIDLDQRINFPMLFPIEGDLGPDRRPLFTVLMDGIRDGKITEVYADDYFVQKRTLKDIEAALIFVDTTNAGIDQLNAGLEVSEEFIVPYEIEAYHVSDYKVKGYWYFDKRQGEMKYRLLAICPVVPDVFTMKNNPENPDYIDLFWIYFPDAREVLHEAKAFNDKNSAMPITFDHLLNSRRFSAVIYKEENVMGDREIQKYMQENALNQLIESERIKEKLRDFEQDMWNY